MKLQPSHLAILQGVFEGSDVDRVELISGGERLVLDRRAHTADAVPPVRDVPSRGLRVSIEGASLFRWTDGDWIVAVNVLVTNDTEGEERVAPSRFALRGTSRFFPWSPVTTLREESLAPGAAIRGVIGFFTSGREPEPHSLELGMTDGSGVEVRSIGGVQPTRGEDRGQPPADMNLRVPTTPVLDEQALMQAVAVSLRDGALSIEFTDVATFRWTDEDWIVTARARVTNHTAERIPATRALFQCTAHGLALRPWGPTTTFAELVMIEPGGEATGQVGFFYYRSLPKPERVTLAYGPVSRPAYFAELQARLDPPRLLQ